MVLVEATNDAINEGCDQHNNGGNGWFNLDSWTASSWTSASTSPWTYSTASGSSWTWAPTSAWTGAATTAAWTWASSSGWTGASTSAWTWATGGSTSPWTWGSSPASPANGVTNLEGVTITTPDLNALAEDVENAANDAVGKPNF